MLSIHPKITGSWSTTSSFVTNSSSSFTSTPKFVSNTEYFWKHGEKTFFEYGNYMPRKQRFPKEAIDLYMMDGNGTETHIKSFDMIHPNTDAGVSMGTLLTGTTCGYRKKKSVLYYNQSLSRNK